jgi:hypothetical protein
VDLLLLSILAIAAEALGILLHGKFPFAGYYISFSTMVAIIALLRWGAVGAVVNCLIAIPAAILSKSVSVPLFLFYFISNSGVMIVPKLFRRLEMLTPIDIEDVAIDLEAASRSRTTQNR